VGGLVDRARSGQRRSVQSHTLLSGQANTLGSCPRASAGAHPLRSARPQSWGGARPLQRPAPCYVSDGGPRGGGSGDFRPSPKGAGRVADLGWSLGGGGWCICLGGSRQIVAVADEVAELAVRDLGDERAARAAQQAATGRLCEITGLGRSVVIHLVRCTQSPDAEAGPGQLKATVDGTVAFRGQSRRQQLHSGRQRESRSASPHSGRAIWAADIMEALQTLDCSIDQSRDLRLGRSGGTSPEPPGVPVTPWWQNTEL